MNAAGVLRVGGKRWRVAVGANLRTARQLWGGTLTAAAAAAGVRRHAVMYIERGVTAPNLVTFVRLCRLYRVRVEDVLAVEGA